MTWLPQWTSDARKPEGEELEPGLERLATRAVYGILLFIVSQVALGYLPYFPDVWRAFLPVLVVVAAVLSLPAGAFLAILLILWALLYSSPAYALWFALFMVILSGIYEDRLEHALLLAATPVLLLFKLGFLPLLLAGALFRARGGLVNGLGCLAALAAAAALGLESFGEVLLTGVAPGQDVAIPLRLDLPRGLLDVGWVGGLTWEGFASDVFRLARRWADTFAGSPVGVAQVILWGFSAIVVKEISGAAGWALGRLRGLGWPRVLLARGLGILAGGLFLLLSYRVLAEFFLGQAAGRHSQVVLEHLLLSSALALVAIVAVGAVELIRSNQLRLPRLPASLQVILQVILRRLLGKVEPRPESPPPPQ